MVHSYMATHFFSDCKTNDHQTRQCGHSPDYKSVISTAYPSAASLSIYSLYDEHSMLAPSTAMIPQL